MAFSRARQALNILQLLLFLTLTVFGIDSQSNGGMTSGGGHGEYVTTEDNPWFIGDQPVHYCLSRDPNLFSADDATVANELDRVFADWVQTIRKIGKTHDWLWVSTGTKLNLSTKFVLDPACTPDTDVTFILGAIPARVRNTIAPDPSLVAITKQETFDLKTGRAKGFVWLTPDIGNIIYRGPAKPHFWTNPSALYNVLMHEIGHLLIGRGHIPGTVMDEQLPAKAVANDGDWKLNSSDLLNLESLRREGESPVCFRDTYTPFMQDWFALPGNILWYADVCFRIEKKDAEAHPFPLGGSPAQNGRMKIRYSYSDFSAGHNAHHDFEIDFEYSTPDVDNFVIDGYYVDQSEWTWDRTWTPDRVHMMSITRAIRFHGQGRFGDSTFPMDLEFYWSPDGLLKSELRMPSRDPFHPAIFSLEPKGSYVLSHSLD